MLESPIEVEFKRQFNKWAVGYDIPWSYLKYTVPGRRGWPDRMLLWGVEEIIWIEWKRPNKEPEPLQAHIHGLLREMGFDVRWYDDWRIAMEEVTAKISSKIRTDPRYGAYRKERRNAPLPSPWKGKDRNRS
jgi:hypothetical protein